MTQDKSAVRRSIQEKFVFLNATLLMSIVAIILVITIVLTLSAVNRSFRSLEHRILTDLYNRGAALVTSSGIALTDMAAELAFGSIQNLVATTVKENEDVVYGVFMDSDRRAWVYSNRENPSGIVNEQMVLTDVVALWADSIEAPARRMREPGENDGGLQIIEFAAPVMDGQDKQGTVRFGMDTSRTLKDIASAKSTFIDALIIYIVAVVGLTGVLVVVGIMLNRKQAASVANPLRQLIAAANTMAAGDYRQPISVQSNDEVGILAADFEIMRNTICEYTTNLETIVNERTAQLKAAHRDALGNAHKAGMTEVATGTLHNIGNVLNSVVTSTTLLDQTLSESKIIGLQKANDLLEQHMGDLSGFFLESQKGPSLLQYYIKIGAELDEEHDQLKYHLGRLSGKVNLIKDAITAQQTYAGSANTMIEALDLIKLIDDALTMCAGTLSQYNIKVQKNYDVESADANAQRNKLMNILINLFTNAKDAMLECEGDLRQLNITLTESAEHILLAVTDNGEGISEENLTKIFNHGFSTKSSGHGFGLHSCANYMTEMGGALTATSQGKGKGATFTLRLQKPECDTGNVLASNA